MYKDTWKKGILYYTGMGLKGEQSFESRQNKTLNESQTNNIQLHLFEVEKKKEYIYKGLVKLASKPCMGVWVHRMIKMEILEKYVFFH